MNKRKRKSTTKLTKAEKKKLKTDSMKVMKSVEREKMEERLNRFKDTPSSSSSSGPVFSRVGGKKRKQEAGEIVKGTCMIPEKKYFRLTDAPDPSLVRPEHVLTYAVSLLKKKWKKREVDYAYMCDQLKAVRQDLTVQHVKNQFTVQVYKAIQILYELYCLFLKK